MDTFLQAMASATPVWELTILHVSWFHGVLAAAYLGTAWLCVLNAQIARDARVATTLWFTATIVLGLLGANSLLHGDVFVTHFLRALAKIQGWYGDRREWQYGIIGAAIVAVLLGANRLRLTFSAFDPSVSRPVGAGLAALLIVFAVRMISAHGTDAVINLRLGGLSLGRLLEIAGMGGVVLGARRSLCLQ
jgi:hypothetical protein